jgi:hypothetical protein
MVVVGNQQWRGCLIVVLRIAIGSAKGEAAEQKTRRVNRFSAVLPNLIVGRQIGQVAAAASVYATSKKLFSRLSLLFSDRCECVPFAIDARRPAPSWLEYPYSSNSECFRNSRGWVRGRPSVDERKACATGAGRSR